MPLECLLYVFNSLFIPVVSYAISIRGAGGKGVLGKIRVLVNDAIRAIFDRRRCESVADLYGRHGIFSVEQLYYHRLAALAFKAARDLVPSDINFSIAPRVPTRPTRRRTAFAIAVSRNHFDDLCLAYRLPRLWGDLPRELRQSRSLKVFCKGLVMISA